MQPVAFSNIATTPTTPTSPTAPTSSSIHAADAGYALAPEGGSGHSLRTVEPAGADTQANLDQHRLAKPVTEPSRIVRVARPIWHRTDVVEISLAAQRTVHTTNTRILRITSDSHPADEAESTVVLTPVINDLLEHQPGDVPFSTHLELENDRARLLADARFRAEDEALGIAGVRADGDTTHGQQADRTDKAMANAPDESDASTIQTQHAPSALPKDQPDRRALAKQAALAQQPVTNSQFVPRPEHLPIGGLIDLVM